MSACPARARLLMVLSLGLVGPASAAEQNPAAAGAAGDARPRVTKAERVGPGGESEGDLHTIGLNERLRVTIEGLKDFAKPPHADLTRMVLYLDDTAMGIHPEPGGVGENTLTFLLERSRTEDRQKTEASRQTWARVLGRPTGFTRRVSVSAGFENEAPFDTEVRGERGITLVLVRFWLFWVSLVGLVVVLALLVWLARVSNIIRDSGPEPKQGRRTFSLGRTQMAFWFVLVLASYLLISLVTLEPTPIPTTVLGLMGIAVLTAVGGAAVDTTKRNAAQTDLPKLAAQKREAQAALAQSPPAAAAAGGPPDPRLAHITDLDERIKESEARVGASASKDFWTDLLSDGDGISLHRFQIVVWTIVLGGTFLVSVYNSLAMPEFDPSLLLLMGISAGAYLTLKIPEKKAEPTAAASPT
jgi:hypothetical protein